VAAATGGQTNGIARRADHVPTAVQRSVLPNTLQTVAIRRIAPAWAEKVISQTFQAVPFWFMLCIRRKSEIRLSESTLPYFGCSHDPSKACGLKSIPVFTYSTKWL
jgi:hypothetical protein